MKILAFVILYSLLFLKPEFSVEQIKYIEIPKDSELVARDVKSNLATITVKGIVDSTCIPYSSVYLKIYRANKLKHTLHQSLFYSGDTASFSFSFQIPAELKEYKISVLGKRKRKQTLDTTIHGIVAGDVYLIEGQSNAFASMRDSESANSNQSEFIRVFASSDPDSAGLRKNLKWFIGRGDGLAVENGHAGQWGLRLGRLLVDNIKIPVAIFNGAFGGTPIIYFKRPGNYKTNLSSNYARLYYRLKLAGLANHVRAILWSQGESDGQQQTTTASYIFQFDTLLMNWKQDYPGFTKTYLFQTRSECVITYDKLLPIEEAQRQEALKHDSDMEIMATSALAQDKGGLHFAYRGGYETFGNRIYQLIARDLYGIKPAGEPDAPNITSAYLVDSTTLVVTEKTDKLQRRYSSLPIQNYELENAFGAVIDSIFISKNKIIFLLSKYPGRKPLVSYLAEENDCSNWLTNSSGIEIVSFYRYPVADSINKTVEPLAPIAPHLKVYPQFFYDSALVNLTVYGKYTIELEDVTGRKWLNAKFMGAQYSISAKFLGKGLYFVRVYDAQDNLVGISKIAVIDSPPPTPNPPVKWEEPNSDD